MTPIKSTTVILPRPFWGQADPFWWISGLNGAHRAGPSRQSLKRYAENARVMKLDVDRNPSIVEKLRIEAIPTLIVFHDGEEKERIIGAVSQDAIDAHLGSAMN
jgi:Thioredoxin